MKSDRDPPARLASSSELPTLRRALDAARADVPGKERMGMMEVGLAAKLTALGAGLTGGGHGSQGGGDGGAAGAGGSGGAAGGASSAAGGASGASLGGSGAVATGGSFAVKALAIKTISAVVVATGVATSGWYAAHRSAPAKPPAAMSIAPPGVAAPPPASSSSSRSAEIPSTPELPAMPKPAERAPALKAAPHAAEAANANAANATNAANVANVANVKDEPETSLLGRAQDALANDPKKALSLCELHKERFASGALAQEREVLAIDALVRLGRRNDAEARAGRFDHSYPGSAYRGRIESILTQ